MSLLESWKGALEGTSLLCLTCFSALLGGPPLLLPLTLPEPRGMKEPFVCTGALASLFCLLYNNKFR